MLLKVWRLFCALNIHALLPLDGNDLQFQWLLSEVRERGRGYMCPDVQMPSMSLLYDGPFY